MELSVRFRILVKVDAEINKFDYLSAMRIEVEANCRLEIRSLTLDDGLTVEMPYYSGTLEYKRSPVLSQVRRRASSLQAYHS